MVGLPVPRVKDGSVVGRGMKMVPGLKGVIDDIRFFLALEGVWNWSLESIESIVLVT